MAGEMMDRALESEAALARKQEREECAKAVCQDCRRGDEPIYYQACWIHRYNGGEEFVACKAAAIHERNREEQG